MRSFTGSIPIRLPAVTACFTVLDPGKLLNPYDPEARAKGEETWDTNYACWWDLPALPEFNTDHPDVRAFLWDVATHWVEFGIDGWRLDVPECIDDEPFWQTFRERVKAANPDAYLRRDEGETIVVILNSAPSAYEPRLPLDENWEEGTALEDLLGSAKLNVRDGHIVGPPIPARSGLVLRLS